MSSNQNTPNPYFSVVIPLYNKEKEIKRAIDSVLNQTFRDFELIVVNDESTDNSLSVVESIQDSRITIISQENKGEFGARNTGIINSHAPYIAFLDGDDEWKPEYLETICSLTIKYPEAGLYCTSRANITDENTIVYHHTSGFQEGDDGIIPSPFGSFANDHLIPMTCSSSVIPKKVLEELTLVPEVRGGGYDLACWGRIFISYEVAYAAKTLVILHQEGENRLNYVPSNMQLDEHPLTQMLHNLPTNIIENYPHRKDIENTIDYLGVILVGNWAGSGAKGRDIRRKISKIRNKRKYWKEVIYYLIISFIPVVGRDKVQSLITKSYQLFIRITKKE